MWPFRKRARREERRNYTGLMLQQIAAAHAGGRGDVEETATVRACLALWEAGLSMACVRGAEIDRNALALAARWLALTGNAVFLLAGDEWVLASEWDVKTEAGRPVAYRLMLPDSLGGVNYTALAGEVLHFRIAPALREPWRGTAPLSRVGLSAGVLATVEQVLSEFYANAPIGSQIIATPEDPTGENEALGSTFRGRRGRVLMRETAQVAAAGGVAPQGDWKPQDLTPNIAPAGLLDAHGRMQPAILGAFGVHPALLDPSATAQAIREAQRHLATWTLQPIADAMGQEITRKSGAEVRLDVIEATQAYDVGGRARAVSARVDAYLKAKEAGLSPQEFIELVADIDDEILTGPRET